MQKHCCGFCDPFERCLIAAFRGLSAGISLFSTGNQGVDQTNLNFFRKCGVTVLILLFILVLLSMTGCIEMGSKPVQTSTLSGADQYSGGWSGQLRMDIDPELRSDLFSLRGDAVLAGNGTLPYLLLNATLLQGKASVVSTKYLLMKLEPNRDYSFEIAKNTKLLPGEYICTLEASGPGGTLASESRRCSLEMDQEDLISSKISSGELIPASSVRALYAGRTLYGYESNERSHQVESLSGEEEAERETKKGAEKESESEENREHAEGIQASSPTSPEDPFPALQPLEDNEKQEDLRGSEDISAKGEGIRSEAENQSNDRSSDEGAGLNAGSGEPEATISAAASLKIPPEEPGGEPEARFVGSSTSKKYHLPDCRYALKIKPENRIDFQSAEEAKSQGYLPCKSCHP